MSVNTMEFKDAAAILNNIRKQVTGETAIAPANVSEFISVATTLVQVGYDPLLSAITQMVSKSIFSIRPYNRKFAGIKMDEEQWGAIVRKLAVVDKDFDNDVRYELVDGQSVDMFKVNKPEILQTNFYGMNSFDKSLSIFRDQLDNAMSGPNEFGRFMAMITQNISDMIEQCHESIARMTIANFIGGKVAAQNGVIHLLTEYNAETGSSETAKSIMSPAVFGNFMKWMYARVATLTGLMTERSQEFQINVTGKAITRHTPYKDQKVYLYAPLLNGMKARVLADAFHPEFLEYADVEEVNYWQSIKTPMQLKVEASYMQANGTIATAQAATIDKIAGVIFDREALGYTTVHRWSATSPFNIKGGYWNQNYVFDERWYNDFTEKGLVLLLD